MIQGIYAVSFLASLFLLILLIFIGYKQNITYYLLMFVAITISNMGYYAVSSASNLETAILGHRLIYFGGVFTPVLILLCVMKLCRLPVGRIFGGFLCVFSIVVLYFAYSIEYRTDYYKRVTLGFEDGATYLMKEYGPMHSLYMILLFGCIAATLVVVLYTFFRQKKVSYKITCSLLFTALLSIAGYVVGRVDDINVEWVAPAYVVSEIIILFLIRRIGMYDVTDSVAASLNEYSTYGYLVFDKHKRYIGCNDIAKEYLPEIEEQKIDMVLHKKIPFLYDNFAKWMNDYKGDKDKVITKVLEKDGRKLKCSLRNLYHGTLKKRVGYLIEVIDDTQQQKYIKLLNNYNQNLKEEVRKKTEHISQMQEKMVLGMADMIENRDSNTGGHIKRTSEVVRIFTKVLYNHGTEYGFSRDFLHYVVKAAPMHDLGKIAVDDRVLRKPGKFTPEEFEEMKQHAAKGGEIVGQVMAGVEDEEFITIAKNVAHYHHEKWNGEGYPEHLSGIGIPLEARIMALADVFDALVSKRCYKEKMDYDKAFTIIEESLGSHFDPELGKLFLQCRPQLEAYYDGLE